MYIFSGLCVPVLIMWHRYSSVLGQFQLFCRGCFQKCSNHQTQCSICDCVYLDFSIQVMSPNLVLIISGTWCLHEHRETCTSLCT